MSISTATPARASGPKLVSQRRGSSQLPVTLSAANSPMHAPDLTIHRVTGTHHGRTLLMLGHAAEYLVDSRRFLQRAAVNHSDNEAIHILMGLSRNVFDEYAEGVSKVRRLDRLLLGFVTRLLN
jgi:hypothetical protein